MKDLWAGILIWLLIFLPGIITALLLQKKSNEKPKQRLLRLISVAVMALLFIGAATILIGLIKSP